MSNISRRVDNGQFDRCIIHFPISPSYDRHQSRPDVKYVFLIDS